jgi:hypothetical protein
MTKSAIQKKTRLFLVRATVANDDPRFIYGFPLWSSDRFDASIGSTASLLVMPIGIDDHWDRQKYRPSHRTNDGIVRSTGPPMILVVSIPE